MNNAAGGGGAHVWAVSALPLPTAVEGPGWADFVHGVRLHSDNLAEAYGTDDASLTAHEAWPQYTDPSKAVRAFVVRDAQQIVALGTYDSESGADCVTAWLHIDVHPDWRRRGVGAAVAAQLIELGNAEGADKTIVYAAAADLPGDRITAATGVGSLPWPEQGHSSCFGTATNCSRSDGGVGSSFRISRPVLSPRRAAQPQVATGCTSGGRARPRAGLKT